MIEYLSLICLFCLAVSVPILIRGCFNIHSELPNQGEEITNRIEKIHTVLDELADVANDFIRLGDEVQPLAQTASSPLMTLLNAFMAPKPMASEYGSETQQKEREIYQVIPPENETETISN
tara:strand:- start:357 stop:719 length:363 start_codon:yes stop_codon:yes gene_type:complete